MKPENIAAYAGSSDPLERAVCAFSFSVAQLHHGRLWIRSRKAGIIYICNPNNPTGTLTSRKDIDYVLANKPPVRSCCWTKPTCILQAMIRVSISSRQAKT